MKHRTFLNHPLFAFILLYLGFMISYVDRSAISLSLAHIGKDFHMGPAELGVVLSAFYLGYAVMQIPGAGWLIVSAVKPSLLFPLVYGHCLP